MSEQAHWDEKYRTGATPWDTERPSEELMRVVKEITLPPCRALELGCGTGTNAVWLAQQGFEVTAVDLSTLAIARARERALTAGMSVLFQTADVLEPCSLGEPFPFFFDRGCYHVVRREGAARYLRFLAQNTHPGSLGLVLAGNAKERRTPGPPVVTEEQLRSELGSIFHIVKLCEFRFDQPEEPRFLGWSCFLKRE